jgi:hypothetical protein
MVLSKIPDIFLLSTYDISEGIPSLYTIAESRIIFLSGVCDIAEYAAILFVFDLYITALFRTYFAACA